MDNETKKRSVRIGMRTVLLSAGLSLALVLSACGDSSPSVTDQGTTGEDTTVVEGTDTGVVVEEDNAVTPEADTAVETDTNTAEETEVITDTEVMTDTDVITETELVTETIVTEVMTDTDVMTDTAVVTDTADVVDTDAETTTETEAVTDTETTTEGAATEATPTPAAEGQSQGSTTTTTTSTTGDMSVVGVTNAPDSYVRASTLTDYDFENVNGDDIGDIEDMLIDLNDGAVLFLSVEYGGFLDLGDRDIYLPLSAFTIGEDGGMYLTMDEQQLDAYPEVSNDWPNFDDPNWGAQLDEYWAGVGANAPDTANRDSANTAWASDLIGFPMVGWGDAQTGVADLLVNLASGKAEYALVADDAIGEDGPYIVPIQALTVNRADGQITFNGEVNDDVITNAPRLDAATYPEGQAIDGTFRDNTDNAWRDLGFDWWNND